MTKSWRAALTFAVIAACRTVPALSASAPEPPPSVCVDAVCATTDTSSGSLTGGAKKWHPGHYMQLMLASSIDPSKQSTRFGYYNDIGSNRSVEGVVLYQTWANLESSKGNYTFSTVRAELEKLKSLPDPKRLIVRLTQQFYGSSGGGSNYYPSYILNGGGVASSSNGSLARLWDPAIADRYIALIQALADEFDSDPYFEGIVINRETAPGVNPQGGYSISAYASQLKRITAAATSAFSKSNVVLFANFLGAQSTMNDLVASADQSGAGIGGPDICPDCGIDSYDSVTGVSGGVDRRGKIPLLWSVEASEMGYDTVGPSGGYTAAEVYAFANNTLRVSHLFWVRNLTVGTSEQRWDTGILPYIGSHPITHTSCPTNYDAGCQTN